MPNTWKSPTNVIASIGLIISIIGNFYQYFSSESKMQFEKEKWQSEFSLEREKWETEREKLKMEIEDHKISTADKNKLKMELEDVNDEIKVWDDALFQDNLKLTLMKNKLQSMDDKYKIETQKKNILANEDAIKIKERERQTLVNRRQEIEYILRGK